MTTQSRENLREMIVGLISTYSPEYVSEAGDSDYSISQLLDSIDEFEEEVNASDPKREAMDGIYAEAQRHFNQNNF